MMTDFESKEFQTPYKKVWNWATFELGEIDDDEVTPEVEEANALFNDIAAEMNERLEEIDDEDAERVFNLRLLNAALTRVYNDIYHYQLYNQEGEDDVG